MLLSFALYLERAMMQSYNVELGRMMRSELGDA
jgi:hypothetical protein